MKLTVLIVDDSEINLTLFKHLIAKIEGLTPVCFNVSEAALGWCQTHAVDIVIVDYMMPAPDGINFIRRFRSLPGAAEVPAIMVTANDLKEVRYNALQAGATDFLTKPVDRTEFTARVSNMAALRRSQKQLADHAALLAAEVAAATATIIERERETIFCLARAAEYRDPETGAHILRMAQFSRLIAAGLGFSEEMQQMIFEAAPMHDIGKVATPDHILLKPARLLPDEFEIMKRHARAGHEILAGCASPIMQTAAVIALSHHEKYDGSGYPNALAADDIPLSGRIVALADVFDALTSERPYKRAWSVEDTAAFIREFSGKHFDPLCVEVLFDHWQQVLAIRQANLDDLEIVR